MRASIAAFLFLAAFAALSVLDVRDAGAAEEPEAVYAKWHRATVTGNFEEMQRYSPAPARAEIAGLSAAQKAAAVKLAAAQMPRAFLLRNKLVDPGGRSARLVVSGPGDATTGEKPETLYGSIRLVMEGAEWKVAETRWNNSPPAWLPSAPAPRAGAPQKASPNTAPGAASTSAAPASAARKTPVVGSLDSAPERKFGKAKPPCVFKPVMTAEDMENCR